MAEEEEVEEGRSSSSAILDLPEPLLLHILSFLTDVRSRHRAALACGRMRAAERATRSELSLRGDPRSPGFLFLSHAFRFPALEHLDLSLVSPWGHPLLSSVPPCGGGGGGAPSASSSSGMNVYHPEAISEQNAFIAARLAGCFPAVTSLAVYCRDPTTLTHLDLGLAAATDGFKSSELGPIAASCPNLRKLVAPCLFNPRFSDCVGDDALLSLATSCPRLTVLRLSEPFEAAANIQREEAAITVAGLVAFFAALPALEDFTMDLQHNVLEAAPAMEALARRCPRIKFLTLGSFQGLCKASWLHLDGVAVCGGLESLYMKNCQDLTDASLAAIGRGCRRLAKFGIHGCDLVTSAGIRRLAFTLRPTLKEVTVLHCRLLHTAECLTALSPIRDRIESLEINCVWNTTEQPCSVANGTTTECDPEDDELGEVYESAAKKCRYMEFDDLGSWEMLRSLSLWFSAGQLLSPLISAGLDSCPVLEEISIKVEGDCRTCPRPAPRTIFGLSDLAGFPVLAKMKLDLSEAVGYALTAPTGQMDLSLWERFYLHGIESLQTLYELDYWPPQDKDVHHRSLTLPAVGLIQRCVGLRKLFIHGTTHEHFMTFFLSIPNLRDMQLREDYYPAPENDLMFTEMRAESWLRFEVQLNSRQIDD
jgi:hypothetical protein